MKKIQQSNAWDTKFKLQNNKMLNYIYQTFNHTYNIEEGSWRSGKSMNNVEAFCMNIEKSPDILHMAIGETIASAKIILFEGDGLGIKYYPDWHERWELINGKKVKVQSQRIFETQYEDKYALALLPLPNTNHPIKYIIACGGGMESSYKAFRGYSLGMVIATEVDLFHPNTINEMKGRTISSQHRRYFLDFNPTDPKHYIYSDFVDYFIENNSEETNYTHTTMDDNPSLSDKRKNELKKEWPEGSVQFQRYIEGKRVVATGLIYTIKKENIIDKIDIQQYSRFIVIADPGENASATAFGLLGLKRDYSGVDVLKDYRHRNADVKGHAIKMPIDYAMDFCTFIKESEALIQGKLYKVYSDSDVTFIREYNRVKLEQGVAYNVLSVVKEEINTRIKTGINMLWTGRLRFYIGCKDTIEAYKTAQYNPKQEIKGIYERFDAPEKGTLIDNVDLVEYGISAFRHELSLWKGR